MVRCLRMLAVLLLGIAASLAGVSATAAAPAKAAPAAAQDSHQLDVFTVEKTAKGGLKTTLYTPAPGVSPEQVAAKLSASGVPGVQVGDASAVGASGDVSTLAACSYGTARTWGCPMKRWSYSGHSHPQIYFLDHSGDGWPLSDAVPVWNETEGIDSWYRWYTGGCPGSSYHCVNVYSGNYGGTGWVGQTSRTLNADGTYITGASIKFNDYYSGTYTRNRNTACHEAGHVLGLDHNTSTSSCLYYSSGTATRPLGDDFNLLETYY
ncbi:reprolysin-like metallopeptidase [Streptomyces sp. NPDC051940]|uniref:reprolysin-like metallopeptidase n=1 Tax=Streptomyces sp. NPDC051940 TaxID=3155675 RepID=UPI0034391638